MREPRFRAWIERYHKYMPVAMIHFEPILGKIDYIEVVATGGDWAKFYPEEFILEQYTGLRDKNGKEICVGDVVRIDSIDELRVGYVDLVNDQYCIVCGEDDEGHKIVAEFYYYSKPEENCEVISNIHEDPELLEEKKNDTGRRNRQPT